MLKEIVARIGDEETEVAVLEDRQLVEYYVERSFRQRLVGNIYLGRVENVLPGMQAAFVDIGLDKNAFLYIDDAIPSRDDDDDSLALVPQPSIRDVLKKGQELLVQIIKEPIGTKGARVTTHITLPGRYLVLLPTIDYVAVSRRIENKAERERLKEAAEQIRVPGMGMIVRTVSEKVSADELKQDYCSLLKLWKKIRNRSLNGPAPRLIHKDLELLQRILRDVFSEDVKRLVVNNRSVYEKLVELLENSLPALKNRVYLVEEDPFARFGIDQEIEKALKRKVWLRSGGYLVIDQTEALTVIDVNTGKYVGSTHLEDTILQTNLEAAEEIARQLRLRDIGGIIIIDLIDMDLPDHQARVLNALEDFLRRDKTKANILGLTQLGLVEMTRKKVRQGLGSVLQRACPYCDGKGMVLTEETVALRAQRKIIDLAGQTEAPAIAVEAHPSVAAVLMGSGGGKLALLEEKTGKQLIIKGAAQMHLEEVRITPLHSRREIEDLSGE